MASLDLRRAAFALLALGAFSAVAHEAAAHEFHTSTAEVEHNRQSGHLEVALRVIPEDLEEALSRGRDRPVRLEVTEGVDALITAYLAARFRVEGPDGEPQPVVWVGKEVSHRAAWLYFEIPVDPETPWTLDSQLLFDLSQSQVNTVDFHDGDRRETWTFTVDSEPVELGLR